MSSSRELTLIEHLSELRRRIFICLVALVIGAMVAFLFWTDVVELLKRPAQEINDGQGVILIATQVTELLSTSVKVSLVGGFILALPVILYQVIRFVAPGLTVSERRYLLLFMPGALLALLLRAGLRLLCAYTPGSAFPADLWWGSGRPFNQAKQLCGRDASPPLLDGPVLRDAGDYVLARAIGHCQRQDVLKIQEVLDSDRLHSGRHHHAHLRPPQPDFGGGPLTGPLRIGDMAGLVGRTNSAAFPKRNGILAGRAMKKDGLAPSSQQDASE